MLRLFFPMMLLILLLAALSGCTTGVNESDFKDRLLIDNDPQVLAARMTYFEDYDVVFEDTTGGVLPRPASTRRKSER